MEKELVTTTTTTPKSSPTPTTYKPDTTTGIMEKVKTTANKWYNKALNYFNELIKEERNSLKDSEHVEALHDKEYPEDVRSTIMEWYRITHELKDILEGVETSSDSNPIVGSSQKNENNSSVLKHFDTVKELGEQLLTLAKNWQERLTNMDDITKIVPEPSVKQVQELKDVLLQSPVLQLLDGVELNKELKDVVSKWNEKVQKIKRDLENTSDGEVQNSEPLIDGVKSLQELVMEMPVLQSLNDRQFGDQLRFEVSLWNQLSGELKEAISQMPSSPDFDPLLSRTSAIDELVSHIPDVIDDESPNFYDSLRGLFVKLNNQTIRLKNSLEKPDITASIPENKETVLQTPLPPLQSIEERQYSDSLRQQMAQWNRVAQSLEPRLGPAGTRPGTIIGGPTQRPLPSPLIINPAGVPVPPRFRDGETTTESESMMIEPTGASTIEAVRVSTVDDNVFTPTDKEEVAATEKPKTKLKCEEIVEKEQKSREKIVSKPVPPKFAPGIKADYKSIEELLSSVFNKSLTVPNSTSSKIDSVPIIPIETSTKAPQVDSVKQIPLTSSSPITIKTLIQNQGDLITTEPTVGKAIPVGGVRHTENMFLPSKGKSEVIVMNVGIHGNQRKLVAVSAPVQKKSTVPGQHDLIHVSIDFFTQQLFLILFSIHDKNLLYWIDGLHTLQKSSQI